MRLLAQAWAGDVEEPGKQRLAELFNEGAACESKLPYLVNAPRFSLCSDLFCFFSCLILATIGVRMRVVDRMVI